VVRILVDENSYPGESLLSPAMHALQGPALVIGTVQGALPLPLTLCVCDCV
jgi:hypothetical protein